MKTVDEKNAKVFLSQRVVLYDPDTQKFLLGKEKDFSKDSGPWQFPGGRLDVDETPEEGLEREVSEELGVSVMYEKKGCVDYVAKFHYKRNEIDAILTFQLLHYKGGEVKASDEHEELRWVSADEIRNGKEYKEWLSDVIEKAGLRIEELEAHEKMLRTLAEFDNYKKRSSEQQKDFAKYASEKVIMDMLPVLDNFHAATSFVPEDQKDSPWLTGIMFIQQQMEKVFEDAGVSVIEIAEGDQFDAETMEAISSKDADDNRDEDNQKVSKIVQKGYMIGDRVMRVARVEIK